MIGFIWRLLVGNTCNHCWKEISKAIISNSSGTAHVGECYSLRCTKCGEIKMKRLYY